MNHIMHPLATVVEALLDLFSHTSNKTHVFWRGRYREGNLALDTLNVIDFGEFNVSKAKQNIKTSIKEWTFSFLLSPKVYL